MLDPAIGQLITAYPNRYKLVMEVARRARDISLEAAEDHVILTEKPVTMAMDDIAAELEDDKG